MVNAVAVSIGQPTPLLDAIVVVVVIVGPLLVGTQFGNGVHRPVLKQVTFKLPPLFI
jgi:hypothetical protein